MIFDELPNEIQINEIYNIINLKIQEYIYKFLF